MTVNLQTNATGQVNNVYPVILVQFSKVSGAAVAFHRLALTRSAISVAAQSVVVVGNQKRSTTGPSQCLD